MKFLSAQFTNFTLLKDVLINFSTDKKHNLTVIRGANDSGKTTMLTAMQWCLFGQEVLPVVHQKNYRMSPFGENVSSTVIQVEIRFMHDSDDGEREYLAIRSITEDPDIKNQIYPKSNPSFTLQEITSKGYAPVQNPNSKLNQIMGSNLKDLFFIDGDRALSFIDTKEQSLSDARSKVRGAIRDMLNIQVLESSISRVNSQANKILAEASTQSGDVELIDIQKDLSELENQMEDDKKELAQVVKDVETGIANKDKQEAMLQKALIKGDRQELVQERETIITQENSHKNSVNKFRREFAHSHYDSSVFIDLLETKISSTYKLLKGLKAEGKIPKTVYPALTEILEGGKCICGEELVAGEKKYKHIEDLLKDQDENSPFDAMIDDLRIKASTLIQGSGLSSDLISNSRENYDISLETLRNIEKQKQEIENKIKAVPDTNIENIREKLDLLNSNLETEKQRKWKLELDIEENTGKISRLKKKFEQISSTIEEANKYNNHSTAAEDIKMVLQEAYRMLEYDQVPLVEKKLNEYFLRMIAAGKENRIINSVEISKDHEILIKGKNGERINPSSQLNGASRRALTLSFCLALTQVTGTEAPLIIDTPFGMMDPQTKKSSLDLLASSNNQLILFLTRAEIKNLENQLKEYTGQYQTITNTEHYYGDPPKLVNKPPERDQTLECECTHFEYCDLCERVDEKKDNPNMKKRK